MSELIFLKPIFKEMIWGGNRLRSDFGFEDAQDGTGECWAIAAHPNGDCAIENGEYAGMKLSELWNEHRELFGNMPFERFPLLIKIIDAKDDLSIQVHPDDVYAAEHENGSFGKTECWYVLDCDDNATIVIGHNAKDKHEMKEMITEKRWNEFIREIPVHKGDFFQINPGCLHAIKGGTLILETQQNSDITYRVYDYDRLQNGKPRDLHIDRSLDVITAPYKPEQNIGEIFSCGEGRITRLISCKYYTVEKLDVYSCVTVEKKHRFMNVSIIDGIGIADDVTVKKGTSFIVPSDYGELRLCGKMSAIISFID